MHICNYLLPKSDIISERRTIILFQNPDFFSVIENSYFLFLTKVTTYMHAIKIVSHLRQEFKLIEMAYTERTSDNCNRHGKMSIVYNKNRHFDFFGLAAHQGYIHRCYGHNFLRFFANFRRKNAVFLKTNAMIKFLKN
jgi:hypothetical protein